MTCILRSSSTTARSLLASPASLRLTICPILSRLWPGTAWSTSGTWTRLYFDGRLSGEAKTIYDWLLDHPAQPTRELRRGARLGDKSNKLPPDHALLHLHPPSLSSKLNLPGTTPAPHP